MSFDPTAGQAQQENVAPGYNVYGDNKCPECGIDLATVDPKKHSVAHYGPDPIAYTPQTARDTLLARQRQASLTGTEIPDK